MRHTVRLLLRFYTLDFPSASRPCLFWLRVIVATRQRPPSPLPLRLCVPVCNVMYIALASKRESQQHPAGFQCALSSRSTSAPPSVRPSVSSSPAPHSSPAYLLSFPASLFVLSHSVPLSLSLSLRAKNTCLSVTVTNHLGGNLL